MDTGEKYNIDEQNGNELEFIRESVSSGHSPYDIDRDTLTNNFIEDFKRFFFTPQPTKGRLFDSKI